MSAYLQSNSRAIAVWILRIVLGLIFLGVGASKVTGTGHTVEWFAAIGWGQWFRYLTAGFDVLGAALLFVPNWTRVGAILLICSVGLGTLISLTVLRGDPTWGRPIMVFLPLTLTVLAAVLALLARPNQAE